MSFALNEQDLTTKFLNDWRKLQPYTTTNECTLYIPKSMTELAAYLDKKKVSYTLWDYEKPVIMKQLQLDPLIEFINKLIENNVLEDSLFDSDLSSNVVYVNVEESILLPLILASFNEWKEDLQKVTIMENNQTFGVDYKFYKLAMSSDMFKSCTNIILPPSDYFFLRSKEIQDKFWPKDDVKIYCIPNVSYKTLTEEHIKLGSTVVDLNSKTIWNNFSLVNDKTTNNKQKTEYFHSCLLTVNKSHLAALPSLSSSSMQRDDEGYFRIYFIKTSPVVVKGYFDLYNIDAERTEEGDTLFGINTDVASLMAIVNPSIFEDKYDWTSRLNESLLVQYILLGFMLKGNILLSFISKNVISKFPIDQVKQLKRLLQDSTPDPITQDEFFQVGLF